MSLASLNDMAIDLVPMTVPAFHGKKGYWTRYDEVFDAGLTELRVQPRLVGYQQGGDGSVDIDCYLEDPAYSVKTYGLVYGDEQFEQEIGRRIAEIFGAERLPPVSYTEQGMQTEDYISMEVGRAWAQHFQSMSNHRLLELTRNPAIASISFGNFSWAREKPDNA